jgi:hypothetical protein
MKSAAEAELVLVADLVAAGEVERMPDAGAKVSLLGVDVAAIRLAAAEPVRSHQARPCPSKGQENLTKKTLSNPFAFPLPAVGA